MGSIRVNPAEVMEFMNGDSSVAHLCNHTFSFINSMALKCAVELNIPDIIHQNGNQQPMTLSALSTALSIPESKTPCLLRLMRLLVHSGFFAATKQLVDGEEEDAFSLTNLSSILVKEKREYCVSPFLILMLDQIFLKPWHSLGAWFRGEDPPTAFEVAHGMGIWKATGEWSEFNWLMNEGMGSDASFTNRLIVGDCREVFGGLRSLVDVGGGTGNMARAIGEAFPEVKCIVFDLPHVVETLEEEEEERDMVVTTVGGDFFKFIPSADAMLLKWVLHDWNDEECIKILQNCKEAIPSKEDGGKVIIVEMVMNTDNLNQDLAHTSFLLDVHMMVHTTGKQRTEQEWKKIFVEAGFREYKILPLLGLRSIIEVYY